MYPPASVTAISYRGLCRCCGVNTDCWTLTEPYDYLGKAEVYGDMLLNCLGIKLSLLSTTQQDDRLVCPNCVAQLRSAFTFKTMVLKTEQAFLQNKNGAENSVTDTISNAVYPVEMLTTELCCDDYMYLDLGSMPDGLDDELPPDLLKEYRKISVCSKKNYSKPIGSSKELRRREAGVYEVETQEQYAQLDTVNESYSTDEEVSGPNEAKNVNRKTCKIVPKKLAKTDGNGEKTNVVKDLNFMLCTNLTAIIKYSYVTPFKCRFNHILCFYCLQNFVDPTLLRDHNLTHNPKNFKFTPSSKNTKIDISRIDCRLCDTKIDDLDGLKRHLVCAHGVKYYMESKDCVVPFKLVKDVNRCELCKQEFPSFHALSKHMNVHFSFFVCETCGLGFMNEASLSKHTLEHTTKRFNCKTCGKIFKSRSHRNEHIRRVHKKTAGSLCDKCDKFVFSHEKTKHMEEFHGESLDYPCMACDKVFKARRLLTYHLRREHMKAYKLECQMCPRKFYTNEALRLHMPTHTGERNHTCRVCHKTYPRLKTLKQHMRIHNNDRRYKCQICGQAFVQNCSLKGHMKSKHPEY